MESHSENPELRLPDINRVPQEVREAAEENPGIRHLLEHNGVPAREIIYQTYQLMMDQAEQSGGNVPLIRQDLMADHVRMLNNVPDRIAMWKDDVTDRQEVRSFLGKIKAPFQDLPVLILKVAKEQAEEHPDVTRRLKGPDAEAA